jgi:hypothetical protein
MPKSAAGFINEAAIAGRLTGAVIAAATFEAGRTSARGGAHA